MRLAPLLLVALLAFDVHATCNVIPSVDRLFPGEGGKVFLSRPFARPGDEVVVSADAPIFSTDPSHDAIAITFLPPGEGEIAAPPITPLDRAVGSSCAPDHCNGLGCRCVRFLFPDTDAQVGTPADGEGLTGPVEIAVMRDGHEMARIGKLYLGDTGFRDDLFPHFVGLPPANRFQLLIAGAGDVQAAEDTAGNLFVPLSFDGLIADDERRTRFFDATVPHLGLGGSVQIDVFTVAGQRLPPLARQVEVRGDDILGTADSRESVFRIAKGAIRPSLVRVEGGGPIKIPAVRGAARDAKQADPQNMIVGRRFAVYESRECDLKDVTGCGPGQSSGGTCIDLDHDGRGTSYFLYALDVTRPDAEPIVVDHFDACDYAGYPTHFPAFGVYAFSATDSLVAYRVVEGDDAGVDVDGNGRHDDLIRSGAFDLEHGVKVEGADGAPRQEVSGTLLAFSGGDSDAAGPNALYWYDAARGDPGPRLVSDPAHSRYAVTRRAVGADPRGRRVHPFDFAVAGARIAFAVPEAVQQEDLSGDGDRNDVVLHVFDAQTGGVVDTRVPLTANASLATLAMTPTRVAFQADRPGRLAVGVYTILGGALRYVCDDGANKTPGLLVPSVSDSIVPCLQNGKLNVLQSSGVVRDLGLRILPAGAQLLPTGVIISGDVLATGVDEGVQHADLDGDGAATPGRFILHTFQVTRGGAPTNFGQPLVRPEPPFLDFSLYGLTVLASDPAAAGGLVRKIFRDVDHDGVFEELIPGSGSGAGTIADNCPTIPNPTQVAAPGATVGDACKCPVLSVETVRAFAGSRVHLPVDFEPGKHQVSSVNFDLQWPATAPVVVRPPCTPGPAAISSRADVLCPAEKPPGAMSTLVINADERPIRPLEPGELVTFDYDVTPSDRDPTVLGASFRACVDPSTVLLGALDGTELACPGQLQCGEIRVDPFCTKQGDCNCDGVVNGGDRVCLIAKFFEPSLRGQCPCEDCNLSGSLNAADAPCITRCAFGDCETARR